MRTFLSIATLVALTAAVACSGRPPARAPDDASAANAADTATDSASWRRAPGTTMPMGGRMPMNDMHRGMMGWGTLADAPVAQAVPAGPAAGCAAVSAALVAQGRRIFAGPGNCTTCHGANAKGSSLAPDLTDSRWLSIDGSYGSIASLVRSGVPRPKQYPAPMPPKGGANLSDTEVCAVSAYIYSLSH